MDEEVYKLCGIIIVVVFLNNFNLKIYWNNVLNFF
jgi:hypothetical protein